MSANQRIPLPKSGEPFLVWAMQHGPAAVELLNNLSLLEVRLTLPGGTKGVDSLILSGTNAVLPLPLRFSRPVTNATGGAVIDAQLRAKFDELLTRLAQIGLNA